MSQFLINPQLPSDSLSLLTISISSFVVQSPYRRILGFCFQKPSLQPNLDMIYLAWGMQPIEHRLVAIASTQESWQGFPKLTGLPATTKGSFLSCLYLNSLVSSILFQEQSMTQMPYLTQCSRSSLETIFLPKALSTMPLNFFFLSLMLTSSLKRSIFLPVHFLLSHCSKSTMKRGTDFSGYQIFSHLDSFSSPDQSPSSLSTAGASSFDSGWGSSITSADSTSSFSIFIY